MSDLEGTVFAGHRIEAVAGRGGVAVVYRATQLDLGRTVALKVLAPDRPAASIHHPDAIPIHASCGARARSSRSGRRGSWPPVVGALDAAHAAGLVHCDVRPGNVLLAAGDHAYLSDFGLTRHARRSGRRAAALG